MCFLNISTAQWEYLRGAPLLFIRYLNDFLFHIDFTADNYADDTTLSLKGKSLREISEN